MWGRGMGCSFKAPLGLTSFTTVARTRRECETTWRRSACHASALVIASHNHADHIGGLIEVVRRFQPTFFMDNGVPATTETYATLLQAVSGAGSGLLQPTNRRISLADGVLQIIPPPGIPESRGFPPASARRTPQP